MVVRHVLFLFHTLFFSEQKNDNLNMKIRRNGNLDTQRDLSIIILQLNNNDLHFYKKNK